MVLRLPDRYAKHLREIWIGNDAANWWHIRTTGNSIEHHLSSIGLCLRRGQPKSHLCREQELIISLHPFDPPAQQNPLFHWHILNLLPFLPSCPRHPPSFSSILYLSSLSCICTLSYQKPCDRYLFTHFTQIPTHHSHAKHLPTLSQDNSTLHTCNKTRIQQF